MRKRPALPRLTLEEVGDTMSTPLPAEAGMNVLPLSERRPTDTETAPLFHLRDFDGSLGAYLDVLYAEYVVTLRALDLCLWGKPITAPGAKETDGRDRLFWHLATADPADGLPGPRRLSPARCAYLPRVLDVLRRLASGDTAGLALWREDRQGARALVVSPPDFSLVVVLHERVGVWRLATAYPTCDAENARGTFRRAAAWWAGGTPQLPPPAGHSDQTAPTPSTRRPTWWDAALGGGAT